MIDKQKEIKKLEKLIKKAQQPIEHDENTYFVTVYPTERDVAETLYDVGYRKAEEVEKETAKDILSLIHNLGGCDATDEWSKGYDAAIDTVYEMISKRYGAEV